MSAESYAMYTVCKAVEQEAVDQVFEVNCAEGKKEQMRRRMTQYTF